MSRVLPVPGAAPVPHRAGPVHEVGSLRLSEHRFRVPLAHARAWTHPEDPAVPEAVADREIEVFARVASSTDPEAPVPVQRRPYLVYLQGGPGMASPRPASDSGWLGLLAPHYRVVLLDQRGTGLSTPLSAGSLAREGDAAAQAAYLEHFRAPDIVADAEAVRATLLAGEPETRWASLGQSFGGFLTLTYLSFAPESLLHCWMTAGLAPIHRSSEEVYRATYRRMAERSREFLSWYPEDAERAGRIADLLAGREVLLPDGSPLSPERFQSVGMLLGGTGRVHRLHYLLESAFAEGPDGLAEGFLAEAAGVVGFAGHPLYALMHEAIYADGPGTATAWAAQRVREELPEFSPGARPLLFTGEMIQPWHFRLDPALRRLREVAELLAAKEDWGRLYDLSVLRGNEVPVAASAYEHDVYVDFDAARQTAASVGALDLWTSPTLHHDALGNDSREVLHGLGELLTRAGALPGNPVSPA